ncbi:hypothetical protein FQA39_LY01926 [Lamprigera yunnana]|nr:hypothetical protein FQA39_LY01926 [Lamprigera yunnana]
MREKGSNKKEEDIETYKCDEKYRKVIQEVTTLDNELNINNVDVLDVIKKVLPNRHWKLSQVDEEGYGTVLNQVKERLNKIGEKYMRRENAKTKKRTSFEVGEKVILRKLRVADAHNHISAKFSPPFEEPYFTELAKDCTTSQIDKIRNWNSDVTAI